MKPRELLRLAMAAVSLALTAPVAHAQSGGSVTERLIELLVEKGVLPRDQAAALLKQAQAEAQATAAKPRPAAAAKTGAAPAATAAGAAATAAAETPPVPPGTVRVTYVPEIVRRQIAEQVRGEVMQQARNEGWAQPNVLPEWVQRITVFGDIRVRGQADLLSKDNGSFPDFNTINAGSGFDTNSGALPPSINTTENRERARIRARLGVDARIDDNVMAEIRIATGNDNSPVSPNQTLGQNGPFTKYALWLDRAYIGATPLDGLTVQAGRGPNPFWTTDLLYYRDLNFDGFAASYTHKITNRVNGFVTAGAFPVFNTGLNFATTALPKYASRDAWLLAIQGGGDVKISDDYSAKLAVGYFNYSNIQGKLSSPCLLLFPSSDSCNTDNSRTLFRQFGNTLFPIRNIVPNPNSSTGGAMPQYYGLASQFGVLDIHGRLDATMFRPIDIALEADFATNLAYNKNNIIGNRPTANAVANNVDNNGQLKSGPNAYMLRLVVGTPEVAKRWDWNVELAYKYLEADSVLDALTDSDFHLGGTNAKGYIVGGSLGLARNTYVQARYFGATQVSGAPYTADVVQADLNVKF